VVCPDQSFLAGQQCQVGLIVVSYGILLIFHLVGQIGLRIAAILVRNLDYTLCLVHLW